MPLLRGPYNARPPAGAAPHSGGRRRKRAGLELLLRNPLFFLIFAVRVSQKFCRATQPEPISSPAELDVKKYGVIVSCGGRRGLLLPDLEGVDTVEQQIDIARQKGGISSREKYTLERFEVVRHT